MAAVFLPRIVPDGSGVLFLGLDGCSSVFLLDLTTREVKPVVANIGCNFQEGASFTVGRD